MNGVSTQDLLSALVGDPAARIRLTDAAAGAQDLAGEYASKLGGNLGPLAPLLQKVTASASAKSKSDTTAALKGAASGNLGAMALPYVIAAGAVGFLLFLAGRATK